MREFDLEAAKRGEPVRFLNASLDESVEVHFIGMSINGRPVVQYDWHAPFIALAESLCMAPKPPIEMYVQVFRTHNGGIEIAFADHVPGNPYFKGEPLGEPQKILVPQE